MEHYRAQGHIDAVDRRGNATTYGLLSLSIGAVPVEPGWFQSHHEVAVLATEVKKKAKSVDGNALHVDQRDHGRQTPPAGIRTSNE